MSKSTKGLFVVVNIGCIECGVSSNVVGVFESRDKAEQIADELADKHGWREGGQNSFEVFALGEVGVIDAEYLPYLPH